MADTTPAQAATPEPQAGERQQSVQEQPHTEPTAATDTTWTLPDALAEVKRLRAENQAKGKRITAAEKAAADAEAASLAEQGRYKELYDKATPKLTEYDTLKERYEAMISQVQATNDKRISAIPEAMKGLVPEYDDPLKVAAWLDANSAVFQKQPAPSLDAGAGSNGKLGATVTDEEVKEFAVRFNVDPRFVDREMVAKAYKR